jgi:predicted tellurium resistance membrane protein TerC
MDFTVLLSGTGLFYLLMLTLLEIVLGIDNIIFISIVTDKLEKKNQRYARNIGLGLALLVRLILLTLASWVMAMTAPLFSVLHHEFNGQDLVLLFGGLFLIYKSGQEIIENMEGHSNANKKGKDKLKAVILQIVMIDIVFSFDSIITAIGLTTDIKRETGGDPMVIIYIAVIISMIIMLIFAKQVSDFIHNRPTIKMIALAFLVAIGAILVGEAFELKMNKNYIYFAMAFSLAIEFMNIRMRKNQKEHLPKK